MEVAEQIARQVMCAYGAFRPNPTAQFIPQAPTERQRLFLDLPHLEAFYGGAAGGGKSSALLIGGLQYVDVPGYSALILRKTFQDLAKPGALLDRARAWLHDTGATWNEQKKQWRFPSGAVLSFGYMENEADIYQYQSAEYQYIALDELTHFTERQYTYLFSRLRRLANATIPIRMRSASNPGGIGADWVQERFIPDDWMADDAEELKVHEKNGRAFVPARIDDNPHLDQAEYEKSLENLDSVTRAQLRKGDWKIRPKGNIYPMWSDGADGHHVITWTQFASIFGSRSIPSHWLGACGQDWGFDPDPCATVWAFTAAQNSPKIHNAPMAGAIFVPLIKTSRKAIAEDVGNSILTAEAEYGWSSRIQYRVMSHEASSELETYHRKCGLLFQKWEPDCVGGIDQVGSALKIRYPELPHPFKPWLKGRPGFYVVVPDDQMANPKGDEGLALLRAELQEYKWVEQVVTNRRGSNRIVPYDFFNHYMDALRGIAAKWFPRTKGLTKTEQEDAQLPDGWKSADIAALPPVEAQRRNDARQDELQRIRQEIMNKRRPVSKDWALDDAGSASDIF